VARAPSSALVACSFFLIACGAASPTPPQIPSDPDVLALLPSGPSSVVVASPRALFAAPASRALITRLVPDARFEALRVQHGIDLRELEQLIVASYDDGDVFVLRGPFLAHVAVAEIAHRMVPIESRAETPRARVGGVFRGARVDAIAIGPHTLAVVLGPPSLSGRLLAALEGVAPAFDASEIRSVPGAPFVWLRPVPLALPVDAPVAILLARERSLAVFAIPGSDGTIAVEVRFTGEFPPGAEANFRQLVTSLAQTDLGRAIGMPAALATLTVEEDGARIELAGVLSAEGLARGLWLTMGADIEEALEGVSEDAIARP
jgi:hypothetical protein